MAVSKVALQKTTWLVLFGKKTIPTAYSFGSGISKAHTFLKKICGISNRIPAPSPVLPSELTAPRCSNFIKISSAL